MLQDACKNNMNRKYLFNNIPETEYFVNHKMIHYIFVYVEEKTLSERLTGIFIKSDPGNNLILGIRI